MDLKLTNQIAEFVTTIPYSGNFGEDFNSAIWQIE